MRTKRIQPLHRWVCIIQSSYTRAQILIQVYVWNSNVMAVKSMEFLGFIIGKLKLEYGPRSPHCNSKPLKETETNTPVFWIFHKVMSCAKLITVWLISAHHIIILQLATSSLDLIVFLFFQWSVDKLFVLKGRKEQPGYFKMEQLRENYWISHSNCLHYIELAPNVNGEGLPVLII